MKVVVIGATGTLGAAIVSLLKPRHEVVSASRTGEMAVDLTLPSTIDRMLDCAPDAVVCVAASAALLPLGEYDVTSAAVTVRAKLYGQLDLVSRCRDRLPDGGSITLTAGRLYETVPGGAYGAPVNAALEGFVRSIAPVLPREIRLNAVSPGWVIPAPQDDDVVAVPSAPAELVAAAFVECVEGSATGQVLRP